MRRPNKRPPWRAPWRLCALSGVLTLSCLSASLARAAEPQAPEQIILSVSLNGEAPTDLFAWRASDGRLLLRIDDLTALGLRLPPTASPVSQGGEAHLAVNALSGVEAKLDATTSTLTLTAQPSLLSRTTVIDPNAGRKTLTPQRSNSAFLNWALDRTQSSSASALSLSLEGGARIGAVLAQSSATTSNGYDGHSGLTRLMSSATWDQPDQARQWIAGDMWTGGSELSPGVLLGGIGMRSVVDDPSQPRHALGSVQGQATLPSQVEVYVDGQRVRTERVRPGEFDIRDLAVQPGARSVEVLVRDPYGRVQRIDASMYVATELLREGMSDVQYAVGALRQDYGVQSNAYGPLAAAASRRWGATNALTLAAQGQARRGLVNLGGSADFALGLAGLVGLAGAASQSDAGVGHLALLRYQYNGGAWSAGASARRQSEAFLMLTDRAAGRHERSAAVAQASLRVGSGSLSISHARREFAGAASALAQAFAPLQASSWRSTGLGYSRYEPLLRAYLRATLTRVHEGASLRTEGAVGATFYFGADQSVSAAARVDGASNSQSIGWSQPTPALGWGQDWVLDRSRGADGDTQQLRGAAQLNATQGQLRAEAYAANGGRQDLRLGAAGGLAWIDGHVYSGQPMRDSFAVVRVGSLPGVPVTVNSEPVGVTDATGRVFVPRLTSLFGADIGIDANATPLDYRFTQLRQRVNVAPRSGIAIEFEATRIRAVVGRLRRADGADVSAMAPLALNAAGKPVASLVGQAGVVYLENLPSGRHRGRAEDAAGPCEFWLDVPDTSEPLIDLREIACQRP